MTHPAARARAHLIPSSPHLYYLTHQQTLLNPSQVHPLLFTFSATTLIQLISNNCLVTETALTNQLPKRRESECQSEKRVVFLPTETFRGLLSTPKTKLACLTWPCPATALIHTRHSLL